MGRRLAEPWAGGGILQRGASASSSPCDEKDTVSVAELAGISRNKRLGNMLRSSFQYLLAGIKLLHFPNVHAGFTQLTLLHQDDHGIIIQVLLGIPPFVFGKSIIMCCYCQ